MITNRTVIIAFISSICLGFTTKWTDFEKTWESYLSKPTHANFTKAYDLLPDKVNSGDYPDEQMILRIFSKYDQLSTLFHTGDQDALRLGFKLFTIADGAHKEELQIDIGKLINTYPKLFLQELKNHRQLFISLNGLICNYGPDFVDNDELRQQETVRRIKSLKGNN
jgi:hypothetical protein